MEMVEHAQPGHLLLLDELCRGTDPEQGAALHALLEHFVAAKRVVVTTHFATLKAKASADPRYAISAMHYDNGRPTYRILKGATVKAIHSPLSVWGFPRTSWNRPEP